MEVVIADISRYFLVLLIIIYVSLSFTSFIGSSEAKKRAIYRSQRAVTVLIYFAKFFELL